MPAHTPGPVHLGTIAAGAVYPYVLWDVSLGASCTSHALTFGDAGAPVRAAYTSTGDSARTFAYGYGPGLPAGSFCQPACDALSSCISGVCVPPPPRVTACTGLPANAVWNTATQITQSWNGSAWLPTEVGAYNAIASSTECRFTCAATHPTWTGSACTNTRVEACTGLPANAVWNTASQITQTWNGTAWLPTTAGVYSATASSTECRFACEAGATWNGTACTASGLVFHASLDNTTADLVNGIVPSVTLGAGQSFTTAHARYATASRSFAFNVNTASYLDYGHRTEFDLGAGQDFTIDTWVYVTSMGGRHRVMSQGTHIDANWVLGITGWPNAYRRTYFAFQDASQTAQVTLQATTDLVANTWYHFAVSRQGGTVRLFVNGNLQASSAVGAQNHSFTKLAATSLNVGQRQNYDNGVSYGALSLNHARLHKGVALFTSNFDVNAMAY